MPAFGAQELSNLVWALAVLGLQPEAAWFRDFEVQVGEALDSAFWVGGSAEAATSFFSPFTALTAGYKSRNRSV
jgi:hypothetical protein